MEWYQPDLAISVFSLVAKNNGFFKSAKQRDFLKKQMALRHVHEFKDAEFVKSNFGIDLAEGQFMWVCDGEVRWADYGRKSYRRVEFAFVMDKFGVVSKNKLHFTYYDNGGGSTVNAEKTELNVWVRDESQALPEFEEITPQESVSTHIGVVGEFLETVVTIKSVRAVGAGYYGTTYQTRMVDESGNIIIYWGIMKDTSTSDGEYKIKLRAKVKDHSEYKSVKQTIVGYAKIKEVIQ